jgi:hypothetical protein
MTNGYIPILTGDAPELTQHEPMVLVPVIKEEKEDKAGPCDPYT